MFVSANQCRRQNYELCELVYWKLPLVYWCDIEITENGEEKCAEEFCENPISGEISEGILQTAGEMYTYLAVCPYKERV